MSHSIRIHSFPLSGHAHRVVLFANLAKIPHEVIDVDLAGGAHKQPDFLKLNPFGQVPVIEDGETVLADSNAILVYLARKYAPDFLPQDPALEAEAQKFLSMAAGEIAFGPAIARLITVFKAPLNAEVSQSVAETALNRLESHLAGREFLVGNRPTIADVAIYTYTAHAPEGNVTLDPFPNVRRWLKTVEGLEGFVPMQATRVGLVA